jgi:PIN domain nuclease of toxin-antitoxin system
VGACTQSERVGDARREFRGAALSALLDTHVWIWWLTPGSPLPQAERDALDVKADWQELFISVISLWEAQVLYARKRLDLPLPFADCSRERPMPG